MVTKNKKNKFGFSDEEVNKAVAFLKGEGIIEEYKKCFVCISQEFILRMSHSAGMISAKMPVEELKKLKLDTPDGSVDFTFGCVLLSLVNSLGSLTEKNCELYTSIIMEVGNFKVSRFAKNLKQNEGDD